MHDSFIVEREIFNLMLFSACGENTKNIEHLCAKNLGLLAHLGCSQVTRSRRNMVKLEYTIMSCDTKFAMDTTSQEA